MTNIVHRRKVTQNTNMYIHANKLLGLLSAARINVCRDKLFNYKQTASKPINKKYELSFRRPI